jgi:ribosome maturation factor RimP
MISKDKIKETAENFISQNNEKFENKEIFIAEIKVSNNNKIQVFLDSLQGVSILDCILISKAIENENDRETEDYELDVSSYGIDKELKLKIQYQKHINKKLKIETTEAEKYTAELISTDESGIKILETKKQKIKGTKKKEEISNEIYIPFENIKSAKPVISF